MIQFTTFTEYKKLNLFEPKSNQEDFSFDPFYLKHFRRTKTKIFFNCCICGSNNDITLHHPHSLRSAPKRKRQSFLYIKFMTNCHQILAGKKCYLDITHGRYSDKSPITFYNKYIAKLLSYQLKSPCWKKRKNSTWKKQPQHLPTDK